MSSLSRGQLLWTGEHWINYLRRPGAEEDSGMVSLYRAHNTPAGSGHAAFVAISGQPGFMGLCADSEDLAAFIVDTMMSDGLFFGRRLPLVEAAFERGGDIREAPTWTITTADHEVVACWRQLDPQYVGPPTANPRVIFTVLTFAAAGSIALDGAEVEGEPYPREVWEKNLGEPHSSCCFALAETMV